MPSAQPFTAEAVRLADCTQHVSHVIAAQAICCGAKRVSESELQVKAGVRVLYLSDERRLCAVRRIVPLTMPYGEAGEPEDPLAPQQVSADYWLSAQTALLQHWRRVTFCYISALEIKPKGEQTPTA